MIPTRSKGPIGYQGAGLSPAHENSFVVVLRRGKGTPRASSTWLTWRALGLVINLVIKHVVLSKWYVTRVLFVLSLDSDSCDFGVCSSICSWCQCHVKNSQSACLNSQSVCFSTLKLVRKLGPSIPLKILKVLSNHHSEQALGLCLWSAATRGGLVTCVYWCVVVF